MVQYLYWLAIFSPSRGGVVTADILGTGLDDFLNGTVEGELIKGLAGNDTLSGLAGADTLKGGGGDDTLHGGDGDDLLIGARGADALDGGEGSDTYRIVAKDAGAVDSFTDTGISGTDTIDATRVTEWQLSDVFDSSTGIDVIQGDVDEGLILFGGSSSVLWDFALMTLIGVDQIKGSVGADTISGSEGDDKIKGLGGDDTLSGNGGADTLVGGGGADTLHGDAGEDLLKGGGGDDALDGGADSDDVRGGSGNDTLVYDAGDSSVDGQDDVDTLGLSGSNETTLYLAGLAGVTLNNIEVIDLAGGGNTLVLDKAAVLALSETGNILTVNGTSADAVITSANEWTQVDDEGCYAVYTSGKAILRILTGINTDGINTPANDAPVADADTASVNEDATTADLIASLLAGDLDPDTSDVLRVTGATNGSKGTVTFNAGTAAPGDETLTYTADGNVLDALAVGESTTDTFTYTVSDGKGSTDTATVTVTITGVNDAPAADADTASVNEDGTTADLIARLLAGDLDPDTSDVLRVTGAGTATKGTVTFSAGTAAPDDETLTYTADGGVLDALAVGESTTDTFTYTVSDGNGSSDTATVTITITGINDLVNADDDAASVNEDGTTTDLIASLLAGDTDPDTSDVLRVTGAGTATKGTVTFSAGTAAPGDETLTYTADGNVLDALAAGESTTDTFTYTVSDGNGSSDTATVTVTITGVNDLVNADADTASVNEDATTADLIASLLAGDTDPDTSDVLRVTGAGTATKGTVTFSAGTAAPGDETLTYTADGNVLDALAAGESTTDTFTYTVSDGQGSSDTATVTVTITGVNDAPVITSNGGDTPTGINVAENSTAVTTVVATDVDNGAVVTYSISGGADQSLFSIDSNTGVLSFLSAPDFENPGDAGGSGNYEVTVQVSDGALTDTQSLSVTVTNVNDVTPASSLDLGALNGSNGFRLDGIDAGDYSGFSVSAAGDVNGDGFADLLIGALFADPGGDSDAGESYVVFGGSSFASSLDLGALDGSNGFRLEGIDADDLSGDSVSAAGDVNGDGFADLLIGAPLADPGGDSGAGESYVVFGGSSFASSLDLGALNGSNGFRLEGIDVYDRSGVSVSAAGDVNGDGFADVLIGAFSADPGGDSYAGESYVVFGGSSFASNLDLGALNGTNGFRLDGMDAFDRSGYSVSAAGDVNGDGFADVLIGAFGADPGRDSYAGESYVVFGGSSFASSLDLGALDGSNGFRLDGIDTDDVSGFSVSAAGDVNGDGFADLLIGARDAAPGGDFRAGESYVVFGGSGFASSLDLGALNGSNGFRLDGMDAFDHNGDSVSAAGDVNGDGFADLLIGAFSADPGGDSYAGESYVVFGGSSFASSLDLATLNGSNGFRLEGIDAGDNSGRSVSAAGDVNGDGFADVLIGAHSADPGGDSDAGESYVIFGGDFRDEADFVGGSGNDTFTGGAGSDIVLGGLGNDALSGAGGEDVLTGGAGADVLNGGGEADTLRGGTGDDVLNGGGEDDRLEGDEGADTLDGGLGSDTLVGGMDNDVFLFNDALGAGNIDTIMDFGGAGATALDVINLDNAFFTALSDGVLAGAAFETGTDNVADAAATRIIYNTTTGALYYDADGSAGGSSAVQFALIATDVDGLSAEDFFVV